MSQRLRADTKLSGLQIDVLLYDDFELEPSDLIYTMALLDIAAVGEVRAPGKFLYPPGLSAADYITQARGVRSRGSMPRVKVEGKNGKSRAGADIIVGSGNMIQVGRSTRNFMVGDTGMIQILLAIFNIYRTFMAATQ